MNTPETQLTPGEMKRQAIIKGACKLFRELLGEHIDEAVRDADETFQRDPEGTATAPICKLSVAVQFAPLSDAPEVNLRLAWSVKKSAESSVTVDPDPDQVKFDLSGKEEVK